MFLLIFGAFLVVLVTYNFWAKRRPYPPGPAPWPIIGNTRETIKRPYDVWGEWREKYGPIYTFWLTEIPVVVLADYETINQTMVKDGEAYIGRQGLGKLSEILNGEHFGVVNTNGEVWRTQRRFILSAFRDFGMGKNLMQTKILDQVEELLSDCVDEQTRTGPVDLACGIEHCIGSVIHRMLFGHSFKKEDFFQYKTQMHELTKDFFSPTMMVISYIKFAPSLPYFKTYYNKMVDGCDQLRRYFDKELADHAKQLESGEVDESTADDFVYVYMNEIRKNTGVHFHEKMLRALVTDLFITGQETTASTLGFLVIYVLNHPHVQQEIHRELDTKIGSERTIEMADRNSLVYLNAVINESQRLHNLLPFNLMRKTTKPVVIHGYKIPAGTAIVPQISCVLGDPKIFPEPHKFKPERFLDAEGKLKKVDELIPFSMGKRQCLGEGLARMELFLITANLFNRFRLEPTDPKHPPTMEKIIEFGAHYHPFSVCMTSRF